MKRRLHLFTRGLKADARAAHLAIEEKTGVMFGAIRTDDPDMRLMLRGGKGKHLCLFEVGVLGRGFWIDRRPSC